MFFGSKNKHHTNLCLNVNGLHALRLLTTVLWTQQTTKMGGQYMSAARDFKALSRENMGIKGRICNYSDKQSLGALIVTAQRMSISSSLGALILPAPDLITVHHSKFHKYFQFHVPHFRILLFRC